MWLTNHEEAMPAGALAATLCDRPFLDRFETDATRTIRTGDEITVDPVAGTVTIHG